MFQDPFSRASTRAALKLLGSASKLGSHALAALPGLDVRRRAAGLDDTTTGRGLALRTALQASIHALQPEAGEPDWGAKRWRPWLILSGQYLEGRKPDYLADRLGLVRGSFHHEQAAALEQLGDALRVAMIAPAPLTKIEPGVDRAPFEAHPFTAPALPPHALLGRSDDLQMLLGLARPGARVALHGLPGSGKSALALAFAHAAATRARFTDGVLWAGVGQQPDALTVLGGWCAALGFSQDDIARLEGVLARAAAIRAAVGVRKLLFVLDDAWQADAAEVLVLGGPNCAHLLTTRAPDLALAFAGANVQHVGELAQADAINLLGQSAPALDAGQYARLGAVAQACAGLPLALALAGAQLRKASVSGITRRTNALLEELSVRGPDSQPFRLLDAAIATSTARLTPTERAALHALGQLPARPNSIDEVAALAAIGGAQAAGVLDALVDAGLLEPVTDTRYGLHLAVAEHARHLPVTAQHEADTAQALAVYYTLAARQNALDPAWLDLERFNLRALLPHTLRHAPTFAPALVLAQYPLFEQRRMWDEATRAIEAVLPHAVAHLPSALLCAQGRIARKRGDYAQAQLAFAQALVLAPARDVARAHALLNACTLANDRGEREQAEALGEQALAELDALPGSQDALERRDRDMLGIETLTQLAAAAGFRGKFDLAQTRLRLALGRADAQGDARTLSLLHLGIGFVEAWLGHIDSADAAFEHSIATALSADARENASIARSLQGWVACNQGDYARCDALSHEGLGYLREGSFSESTGLLRANLGLSAANRGHWAAAEQHLRSGLEACDAIGHREGRCLVLGNQARLAFEHGDLAECARISRIGVAEADALLFYEMLCPLLGTFGECLDMQGQTDDADGVLMTALALAHEMQRPWLIGYTLNCIGDCRVRRAEWDSARDAFDGALAAALPLRSRSFEGIAQLGLARAHAGLGDVMLARAHAGKAHVLLASIDHVRASVALALVGALA